jgi:NADPH:quinone reductase-like Zn-dependent oxidoreductase
MKAVVLTQPGGVENLILTQVPTPLPKDNDVLLQVSAISINPVDVAVRGNEIFLRHVLKIHPRLYGTSPVILGWDISGVVTETGNAVTKFRRGDEVFGMVNFEGQGKAYAEYVAAPEHHLALKPANITHEEAAAATLAALTAWQALVTHAKIKKDDKVLIHSASGGVGHYAVQIAKYFGAYVIGTSSAANKDFVLGLGADQHIDYSRQRFEEVVTDADIVLDSVGEDGHLQRSLAALKKGGRLISILHFFTDEALLKKIKEKDVFAYRLGVESNGEEMQSIAGLLEKGALHSHVSKTFPFTGMAEAHTQVATGKTKGKIVVTI